MFVKSVDLRLNVRHSANRLSRCYIYQFVKPWVVELRASPPVAGQPRAAVPTLALVAGQPRTAVPTLEEERDCLVSSTNPGGCRNALKS